MERLTLTTEKRALMGIDYPTYFGPDLCKEYDERLKAYEDTGLEPEQIRNAQETLRCFDNIGIKRGNEIVTAEEEGRLVVLPCKVGDTVYRICREYKKGSPFIRAVTFNQNNFWRIVFCGEFGKTVFLTREEAEAALKGEGNG